MNSSGQFSVIKGLSRKNVLITGATGFVGKAVVEKLLRDTPDIGKIFLLIRNNATERLEKDILESRIFDRLSAERPDFMHYANSKLVPVNGDVQEDAIGLKDKDVKRLREEVNIVIHCAASTDFKERLDDAVRKNVVGTLQLFELSKTFKHLECFVHVSTAYVNSDRMGYHDEVLPPLNFDPEEMMNTILQMDPVQIEKVTPNILGKYPNTYTFTKAMTERILEKRRGNIPMNFIRPTIIGCSWKEPVPGWIDSVSAIAAIVLYAGLGLIRFIHGDYQKITDIIPVDTVTNVILASIPATIGQNRLQVFHVGTSHINPVRWFEVSRWICCYWRQHSVKRRVDNTPLYFRFYKSETMYQLHYLVKYKIPATAYSAFANSIGTASQKKNAAVLKKVSDRTMFFADLFRHFSNNEWIFSVRNTEQMMSRVAEDEKDKFYFALRDLDWEKYYRFFCYGMQRFVLKEDVRPPTDLLKSDIVQEPRKLHDDIHYFPKTFFPDLSWAFKTYRTHIGIDNFATMRTLDETKAMIIKSSRVQEAIKKVAMQESVSEQDIIIRANSILDRMSHTLTLSIVRWLGWFLRKIWKRIYQGIHVDESGLEVLRKTLTNGPILLIPTHRSYIDFLIVSYIFFEYDLPLPHIAAGEDFLAILFVNWVFRNSGAFFLRRSFKGDILYIALFTEYVQRLVSDWSPIEFFIEGKRSRTGKSLHPKYGLLHICLEPFLNKKVPDITIVPISISYEKVLEAELYSSEMLGEQKVKESLEVLLRASIILKHNFGRINVIFNTPISTKDYVANMTPKIDPFTNENDRRVLLQNLGFKIVYDMNQGLVITPTALVGTSLLTHRKGITTHDLVQQVDWLREEVSKRGHSVAYEGTTQDLVEHGLELLRNAVVRTKKTVNLSTNFAGEKERPYQSLLVLSYYRNTILHIFSAEGMIACAFSSLISSKEGLKKSTLVEGAQFLNRLLWLEFVNKPTPNLEEDFAEVFKSMVVRGWLTEEHGIVHITAAGEGPIIFLCHLFWPFIDSYWVVAVSLYSLQPNLSEKKSRLTQRIQWLADKMHAEDKLQFYESCSAETLLNGLELFQLWKVIDIKYPDENAPKATGKRVKRKDRKKKTTNDPPVTLTAVYQKESNLQDLIAQINEFRKGAQSREATLKRAIISDFPVISKL